MKTLLAFSFAALLALAGCDKANLMENEELGSSESDVVAAFGAKPPSAEGRIIAKADFLEVEILPESSNTYGNELFVLNTSEGEVRIGDAHNPEDIGRIVVLPEVRRGAELVFENRTAGTWQSGPASRNADGYVHVQLEKVTDHIMKVSFEDLPASLWRYPEPDFNDAVFIIRPCCTGH